MRGILLAIRCSRWLRILADKWDRPVSSIARELRTGKALAIEIARLLDRHAREEASSLLDSKKPLPPDADWLTRHYFTLYQEERKVAFEQEQSDLWDRLYAAQEARKHKGQP